MPDFKRGQVWRAKRPKAAGPFFARLINDRQIVWVDSLGTTIQYDSPTVAPGRHYPKVSREAFEKWAGREVTDELPDCDWQKWDDTDPSKNK
ncbi:hypothetical protein DM81_3450 [Burkholderia multivorans]|uniref:hypothetical protein n=1 Tax=Burkholderia multivorans TaxID=87883 RepID=UPI00050F8049|nr:hypothetical protein [Burkholderia multivorans]KGC03547.1 hypothetical protein DM81_3450 [Burkholderia multivorans]